MLIAFLLRCCAILPLVTEGGLLLVVEERSSKYFSFSIASNISSSFALSFASARFSMFWAKWPCFGEGAAILKKRALAFTDFLGEAGDLEGVAGFFGDSENLEFLIEEGEVICLGGDCFLVGEVTEDFELALFEEERLIRLCSESGEGVNCRFGSSSSR